MFKRSAEHCSYVKTWGKQGSEMKGWGKENIALDLGWTSVLVSHELVSHIWDELVFIPDMSVFHSEWAINRPHFGKLWFHYKFVLLFCLHDNWPSKRKLKNTNFQKIYTVSLISWRLSLISVSGSSFCKEPSPGFQKHWTSPLISKTKHFYSN